MLVNNNSTTVLQMYDFYSNQLVLLCILMHFNFVCKIQSVYIVYEISGFLEIIYSVWHLHYFFYNFNLVIGQLFKNRILWPRIKDLGTSCFSQFVCGKNILYCLNGLLTARNFIFSVWNPDDKSLYVAILNDLMTFDSVINSSNIAYKFRTTLYMSAWYFKPERI